MGRISIAVAFVCLLAGAARAEVESEGVKSGVAAYEDLDYQRAVDQLREALKETLTREEKRVAFTMLAFSHISLGQRDLGRRDFEQLLRIDPDFQLDRTISPQFRTVFEEARRSVATGPGVEAGSGLPQLKPLLPKDAHEGRPAPIHLSYLGGVGEKMEIYYRTRGQLRFQRMLVTGKRGVFDLIVPGVQVQPPALEFYCDVLDDNGAALAVAGSLGRPLALDVVAKKVPIYKKGWFWGTLAAIAVAGAAAGALGATLGQGPGPNAPGTISVHPF